MTILLIFSSAIFSQTEIKWWVVDDGAGMRLPSSGDTLWISIGQGAIGPSSEGTTNLGAGYLYSESTELKLVDKTIIPKSIAITSISPNPFNSACEIEFEISNRSDVSIVLFDMLGKKVENLADEKELDAGKYRLVWNAGNLPSGAYFVKLNAENKTITRKIILVK